MADSRFLDLEVNDDTTEEDRKLASRKDLSLRDVLEWMIHNGYKGVEIRNIKEQQNGLKQADYVLRNFKEKE